MTPCVIRASPPQTCVRDTGTTTTTMATAYSGQPEPPMAALIAGAPPTIPSESAGRRKKPADWQAPNQTSARKGRGTDTEGCCNRLTHHRGGGITIPSHPVRVGPTPSTHTMPLPLRPRFPTATSLSQSGRSAAAPRRTARLPRHAHGDEALVEVHAFVNLYRRLGSASTASASADMSTSANILTIARSRSGLAVARLSSARACRGTLSGAVIVLISFGLRHLEDQPVAVHLCGHHPYAGANPRIRSNPYTISMDATLGG